jgi:hypothetical protein
MFKGYRVLAVAASLLLAACDADLPGESEFLVSGYAEPLSESKFEALSPEQQYQVVNKLLGTIYKGMPVDEYLDLSSGLSNPELKTPNSTANTLRDLRDTLETDLNNGDVYDIDQTILNSSRYDFSGGDDSPSAKEEPLAYIHESPVSRTSFVRWMAHFLANTIMFSPAEEMESTFNSDVRRTYTLLVEGINAGHSVRQIIRSQLPSLQRWRVARTPENVGIEGFELYLGLFETIQDSKKVGIACQNFYLTDADDDYRLVTTDQINTDPQLILRQDSNNDGTPDTGGYFITTCDDFYDVIAGHALTIPRTCEVIINYLMAERTLDDRLAMCESLSNSGATTFEDIFKSILFSEQYLLHTERPKGFEEVLMPALNTLKWDSRQNPGSQVGNQIWENMASDGNSQLYMGNMSWNTMTLKIGRLPNVPLDTLGFANYHKAVREGFLLNDGSFEGGNNSISGLFNNANGSLRGDIASLNAEDFVHFLFLSVLHRSASNVEIDGLMPLITTHLQTVGSEQRVINGRHDDISDVVLDYISRLSEFYYFKRV